MTAALAKPRVARLGGDPAAIRQSALAWSTRASEWSLLADELRSAAPEGFVGDEGDTYRAWLADRWAARLDGAAQAWAMAGRALGSYAEELERAQQRLRAIGAVADDASSQDGGNGAGDTSTAHGWVSEGTAVLTAGWTDTAAGRVHAEHAEAVRRCRAAIDRARATCPAADQGPGPIRGNAPAVSGVSMTRAPALRTSGLAPVAGGLRAASGFSALAWTVPESPVPAWTAPGLSVPASPAGGSVPSTDAPYPVDGLSSPSGGGTTVTVPPHAPTNPCDGAPPPAEPVAPVMPPQHPTVRSGRRSWGFRPTHRTYRWSRRRPSRPARPRR